MSLKPIRFIRFLQEHRLRLAEEHRLVCQGARIHPEAASVFVRAALEAGLGSSVQIAAGMRFFELEALLKDPARLRLALEVDKQASIVRLTLPRTKEEQAAELKETLAKDHSAGLALLRDLKQALNASDFEFCLRGILLEALKGYGEERRDAPDFEFLLQELVQLGDHELNLKVIAELKNTKAHDIVWAIWALIEFRETFPEEVSYHREYGDLNFQDQVYDEAVAGYRAALALAPEQLEAKAASSSQPPPKARAARKRKIGRGRRKALTAKKKPPQTLTAKLQEAERLLMRQQEQRVAELRRQMRNIWQRLKPGQDREALSLINAIIVLGAESFETVYQVAAEAPRRRLAKLDYLRDLCSVEGLEPQAEYFQFLGDELVGRILEKIIRGRSFGSESMERVNIRQLGIAAAVERYEMPESAALVIELLRENLIEEIASSIIVKLGDLTAKLESLSKPSRQDIARYIVADFALRAMVRDCPANAAELYAMGGAKLADDGNYQEAKRALNKALEADPACVPALEKLAVVANLEGDYAAAMGFARRIIDQSRTPAGLFDQQRPKIAYAGMTMDASAGRLLDSARLHLGYAALQLYEATPQPELLEKAIASLEPLIASGNGPLMIEVCLAKAYFYSGRYRQGLATTLGYWRRLISGDSAPVDFLKFVIDQCLSYFGSQADYDRQLEVDLINHGIYLLEYGLAELAQPIFDLFRSEENRGTDSFYYAQYAHALAAYREDDYETCRQRLRLIIEAADVRLKIHSYELGGLSSLKANAHSMLFQTYRSQGTPPPLEAVGRALEEFPDDPIILNVAAVVYDERDEVGQARELFERAIAATPHFADPHLNYLDMLLRQSQADTVAEGEIRFVMDRFRTNVEQTLERAREEINQIGHLDSFRFLEFVVDLYCQHRYEPLLALLRTILQTDLPVDLSGSFSQVIGQARENAEAGRQTLPEELLQLVN